MFVVKPVGNRTSFFWQSQRVLLCCITAKRENFSFPCAGHSPSDVTHLPSASSAPAQKGNLSFRSETTLPPKNTLFLVSSTMSWDLQLPLLQSNWSARITEGTCWLLQLPGLPWPSEPFWTCCSQQGEGGESLREICPTIIWNFCL